MEWCWSREYFRFTFARHEWESDADTIESIAQSLRDGESLASAYKAMVHTAQFQTLYKAPRSPSEGAE